MRFNLARKSRSAENHRAHDVDERQLKRLRRRLTGLMLLLLLTLLLVLGFAVYTTMQSQLLQPARQAVKSRADSELSYFKELERSDTEGTGGSEPIAEQEVGGVGITFMNRSLKVLAGSQDPFGKSVPDPGAARAVLQSQSPVYSTVTRRSDSFLIYTAPAFRGGKLAGVVQTGISEKQYTEGLNTLLLVLFGVGGFGLIASTLISFFVVRRALVPIKLSMRRQRDFVADAAHELRTPLSVIRTSAELGLIGGNGADGRESLEQILAQGNHLTRLVEDLSLLARADTGSASLHLEDVNLTALLEDTVTTLAVLAESRGIVLKLELPDQPVHVKGDSGRLRQLLVVLVDNALKHTPAGQEVVVSAWADRSDAIVRVRDSGPGIAEADMANIFDRFYRSPSARAQEPGAGLGLAIGKWIAEAHGGRIEAANDPAGGAIFSVSLPKASPAGTTSQ